eukprot:TRINITY_DN24534_c0_g1_i3.p1 TRINITY_DN24534_c0_g1~~TRINITY_DN24534_c0_g1_i3.p1  ORF type:complete len:1370 (-),score=167.07 TRINITY_DN24534_c0_g1_i3:96-4205(-)
MDGSLQFGGSMNGTASCEISHIRLWLRELLPDDLHACLNDPSIREQHLQASFPLTAAFELKEATRGNLKLKSLGVGHLPRDGVWALGRAGPACITPGCTQFVVSGAGVGPANGLFRWQVRRNFNGAPVYAKPKDKKGAVSTMSRDEKGVWLLQSAPKIGEPMLLYTAPGRHQEEPPRGNWTSFDFQPNPSVQCEDNADCEWTSWSPWSSCSVTCGIGDRVRSRVAGGPENAGCNKSLGDSEEVQECKLDICPKNCEWGTWQNWESCSVSCGGGLSERKRPKTVVEVGGGVCLESDTGTRGCNSMPCPIDCKYGSWSDWSSCDVNCGGGTKVSTRGVSQPVALGGRSCIGDDTRKQTCSMVPCPDACDWSNWGEWTSCSATCGNGLRSRVRISALRNVEPGMRAPPSCPGEVSQTASCRASACPLDCVWASWGAYGSCSRSCGGGLQKRTRSVATAASSGGNCDGLADEQRACNTLCCPVDCKWSSWTQWSDCTRTCQEENYKPKKTRWRNFSSIVSCGGKACAPGPLFASQDCNLEMCPINCQWATWGEWSACSLTCGWGMRTRRRPVLYRQKYGGQRCKYADKFDEEECASFPCPVHCAWKSWNEWEPCTKSCNGGFRRRVRALEEDGDYGGEKCNLNLTSEFDNCNAMPCPQDCQYAEWMDWLPCTATCGGGMRTRYKIPAKEEMHGGASCNKSGQVGTEACNEHGCELDCKWGSWHDWGPCIKQAHGGGLSHRVRDVLWDARDGGRPCKGGKKLIRECGNFCTWSAWTAWSMCSASCVPAGSRYRTRTVLTQGRHCPGNTSERAACATGPCPVDCRWMTWGMWGDCDASCGGGLKRRSRGTASRAAFGGKYCSGNRHQFATCNTELCMTDCQWYAWDFWGVCSATCGKDGKIQRFRLTRPATHGGKACEGSGRETKECPGTVCPIDCRWENWGDWSHCSKSCGNGLKVRNRGKIDEKAGGARCAGMSEEKVQCTDMPCPIDAWITDWTHWQPCPTTCGAGSRTKRHRKYYDARLGGKPFDVVPPLVEETDCREEDMRPCPIDCQLGPWTSWTKCDGSCDKAGVEIGITARRRAVERLPESGGAPCRGVLMEVENCTTTCDIDCKWSSWTEWSCFSTCGGVGSEKTRYRFRDPSEMGNGTPCDGNTSETKDEPDCIIPCDCLYDAWTEWTPCQACTRLKNRSVMRIASGGGRNCTPDALFRVELCDVMTPECQNFTLPQKKKEDELEGANPRVNDTTWQELITEVKANNLTDNTPEIKVSGASAESDADEEREKDNEVQGASSSMLVAGLIGAWIILVLLGAYIVERRSSATSSPAAGADASPAAGADASAASGAAAGAVAGAAADAAAGDAAAENAASAPPEERPP